MPTSNPQDWLNAALGRLQTRRGASLAVPAESANASPSRRRLAIGVMSPDYGPMFQEGGPTQGEGSGLTETGAGKGSPLPPRPPLGPPDDSLVDPVFEDPTDDVLLDPLITANLALMNAGLRALINFVNNNVNAAFIAAAQGVMLGIQDWIVDELEYIDAAFPNDEEMKSKGRNMKSALGVTQEAIMADHDFYADLRGGVLAGYDALAKAISDVRSLGKMAPITLPPRPSFPDATATDAALWPGGMPALPATSKRDKAQLFKDNCRILEILKLALKGKRAQVVRADPTDLAHALSTLQKSLAPEDLQRSGFPTTGDTDLHYSKRMIVHRLLGQLGYAAQAMANLGVRRNIDLRILDNALQQIPVAEAALGC